MDAKQITSKFLSIQWRDFFKGLIIALAIPIVGFLYQLITHWFEHDEAFIINWKELARAAFYGFTAYIAKNFLEPTQTVIVVKPALDDENVEKDVKITAAK